MNKSVLLTMLCLLLAMTLGSCGKKAKDSSNSPPPTEHIEDIEISPIEETHLDLQKAILDDDLSSLETILAKKNQIDLNKHLDDGETLMTLAARHNRFRMIQLLHENSGSLFKTNTQLETPLMVASRLGHENLVKLLISLGSKTDDKDKEGNTALHLAIIHLHEEIALHLINSGTNIDITNNSNHTALKLAEMLNLSDVLELLRSLTYTNVSLPDRGTIRNLISLGNVENINATLTKYPSLVHDYKDMNLYVLAMESHEHDTAMSITLLLMSYGPSIDGPQNAHITPLIWAAKQKQESFVKLFLREDADPKLLDITGESALVWGIKVNSPQIVKALLKKHAPERYTYYKDGKKKTMRACDVAREVRKKFTTTLERDSNEEIMEYLGCFNWFF